MEVAMVLAVRKSYTAKFANVRIAGFGKKGYFVTESKIHVHVCSSKMKLPRLQADCVVLRGQMSILASCCLSPMRKIQF